MRFGVLLATFACLVASGYSFLVSSSHSKSHNLIGFWTTSDKDLKNESVEFRADGTLVLIGSPTDTKGVSMRALAKYRVDGDKVTVTLTSMKMLASPGADKKARENVTAMNKMFTQEMIKKAPPDVAVIKWSNADSFTITDIKGNDKGKVTIFTRKGVVLKAAYRDIVVTGDDKARAPKSSFNQQAPFVYVYFNLDGIRGGEKLKSVWVCEHAPGIGDNIKIDEATLITKKGTDSGHFSLSKPTKGWPKGTYRVDLYINGVPKDSANFEIVGG